MRMILLLAALTFLGGCIHVKTDPIVVEPIRIDVYVRIDRALDDFFNELDQDAETLAPPSPHQ